MSDAALTDSTTATDSPLVTLRPASGTSTNTTSPNCSWAYGVMPTVPTSPSTRIHSCSLLYLTLIGGLLSAVVGVFDEGHRHDLGRHRIAAHHELEFRAIGRVRFVDVAHGDGAPEGRRESARRDLADDLAADRDLRALAPARLALGPDGDPSARRARGDLLPDNRSARKAALDAAFLADAPQQHGFDRRRRGVDVVAVQARSGREAPRG